MKNKRLPLVLLALASFVCVNMLTPDVKPSKSMNLSELQLVLTADAESYNDTIVYPPGPFSPAPNLVPDEIMEAAAKK